MNLRKEKFLKMKERSSFGILAKDMRKRRKRREVRHGNPELLRHINPHQELKFCSRSTKGPPKNSKEISIFSCTKIFWGMELRKEESPTFGEGKLAKRPMIRSGSPLCIRKAITPLDLKKGERKFVLKAKAACNRLEATT